MAEDFLSGAHERLFHEAVKVKPGLCWRSQNVGAIRAIEYLLRRASESGPT